CPGAHRASQAQPSGCSRFVAKNTSWMQPAFVVGSQMVRAAAAFVQPITSHGLFVLPTRADKDRLDMTKMPKVMSRQIAGTFRGPFMAWRLRGNACPA